MNAASLGRFPIWCGKTHGLAVLSICGLKHRQSHLDIVVVAVVLLGSAYGSF